MLEFFQDTFSILAHFFNPIFDEIALAVVDAGKTLV